MTRRRPVQVHQTGIEADFIRDLSESPPGTRAVVYDVGCNSGEWTAGFGRAARSARAQGKSLELHLIEPQPHFRSPLTRLATELGPSATFVSAAAGKTNGTTTLRFNHAGSPSATLSPFAAGARTLNGSGAQRSVSAAAQNVTVPMIDLAEYLRRTLPARGDLSFLKLDVESFEYALLPYLLVQGRLCDVTYLLLEWHLNSLPLPRRLSGLGLRLSFHELLEQGCQTPPRAVHHDDFAANNVAVPVPGLDEVAVEHAAWATKAQAGPERGRRPSSFTVLQLKADEAWLSEHDGDSFSSSCSGGGGAGRPTRCAGDCRYEAMACSWNHSAESYRRQMRNPVVARRPDGSAL